MEVLTPPHEWFDVCAKTEPFDASRDASEARVVERYGVAPTDISMRFHFTEFVITSSLLADLHVLNTRAHIRLNLTTPQMMVS